MMPISKETLIITSNIYGLPTSQEDGKFLNKNVLLHQLKTHFKRGGKYKDKKRLFKPVTSFLRGGDKNSIIRVMEDWKKVNNFKDRVDSLEKRIETKKKTNSDKKYLQLLKNIKYVDMSEKDNKILKKLKKIKSEDYQEMVVKYLNSLTTDKYRQNKVKFNKIENYCRQLRVANLKKQPKYSLVSNIDDNKLKTLMGECGFDNWLPLIKNENAFHYTLQNNKGVYVGNISYSTSNTFSEYMKNLTFVGLTVKGLETAGVCISTDKRGTGLFNKLFYGYLNDKKVDDTWLWTTDKNELYFNYGFEYIYNNDSKKIKNDNKFIMKYKKNNFLNNKNDNFLNNKNDNFKKIKSVNQNTQKNESLCGLYVLMNTILIVNISKYNINLSLLNNDDFTKKFIKKLKDLIFRYVNSITNTETKKNIKNYYQYNKNIPNFDNITKFNITEVNGLTKFNENVEDGPIHLNISIDDMYFNTDVFEKYSIIVERNFNEDEYCNSVLYNPNNLKIIRNFYNLDNYILSFIVGNEGHWKCYVVNKVNKKKEYIFINSLDEGPDKNMSTKIKNIVNHNSYTEFLTRLTNCFEPDIFYNKLMDDSNTLCVFNIPDIKRLPPIFITHF